MIGVRNAQAAENYNKEIGGISWITFIFFPLIAVSVCSSHLRLQAMLMHGRSTQIQAEADPFVGYVWYECGRSG
jgi:hypothetical protein